VRNLSLWTAAWEAFKRHGLLYVARWGVVEAFLLPSYFRSKILKRSFVFDGRTYAYANSHFNRSWSVERAVEIPIVYEIVQRHRGGRVLEVGNVLSHYFPITHTVVDKYEQAAYGLVNKDIVEFNPILRFDLIVSISTIEHVGWDEIQRDPSKSLAAIRHLCDMLAPGGELVVTVPIAHNPCLDDAIGSGVIGCEELRCLKRVSSSNRWVQTTWDEIKGVEYGRPFPAANGLAILFFRGPPEGTVGLSRTVLGK
jgi:hypothetical protein